MSQSSNLTSTGAHLILSLAQYTERKVRKCTVRYRITTPETLAPILPWRRCANSWRGHSGSQYSAGNKIIHHRDEASRSRKVIGQYNTADVDVSLHVVVVLENGHIGYVIDRQYLGPRPLETIVEGMMMS